MKLKIYLDTSVISARFDDRNPARKALTENFFNRVMESDEFEVYISELTLDEITKTKNQELKHQMQLCTLSFTVLRQNATEVVELANQLLQYQAVPQQSREDAFHIAIAVVSGIDYLLSWNFKHIVRLKTKDIVRMVTTVHGYKPINIIAPTEFT
jgi:predicted nucleic acid-binding protein